MQNSFIRINIRISLKSILFSNAFKSSLLENNIFFNKRVYAKNVLEMILLVFMTRLQSILSHCCKGVKTNGSNLTPNFDSKVIGVRYLTSLSDF